MRKVQSVLPLAAEEKSWFSAIKRFLLELKSKFPAFDAVGLKTFARGYLRELQKTWQRFWEAPVREPWQNCPRRAHGARHCRGTASC